MKMTLIATAVLAATLAAGGIAAAQGRDDRGNDKKEQRDNRGQQKKADRNDRHEGRGGGPEHNFYRGDRLPPEYHHKQYVVDDWRGHNLRAPPRGYHWVQSGADYVLVAIATGVILDLMLYH